MFNLKDWIFSDDVINELIENSIEFQKLMEELDENIDDAFERELWLDELLNLVYNNNGTTTSVYKLLLILLLSDVVDKEMLRQYSEANSSSVNLFSDLRIYGDILHDIFAYVTKRNTNFHIYLPEDEHTLNLHMILDNRSHPTINYGCSLEFMSWNISAKDWALYKQPKGDDYGPNRNNREIVAYDWNTLLDFMKDLKEFNDGLNINWDEFKLY